MRTLIIIGLLAIAGNLLATALPLSGQILTAETAEPVEYATVSVFGPDSSLVDGTVTDAEGRYAFQLERGSYRLEVSFLGFQTASRQVDLKKRTELPTISLRADGVALDAVEVTAQRSQMSLLLDKKVFDIGSDLLSTSVSADGVLDQLPSVTVSPQGEVSLRGNAGVRVLIDGRPSALANNNALDAIPAASIERVEVITNPSAKYESAGSAGIINIILKKESRRGYGGTASLSTGHRADHRANLNLNYRREKFSAFANVGGRYSNYRGRQELDRVDLVTGTRTERRVEQFRHDDNLTGFVGFDYQPDEATTITASYSIYDVTNDDEMVTSFRFLDEDGGLIRSFEQPLDYLEPATYHQLDLAYTRELGEDRKFTAYLKSDQWRELETEDTSLPERFDYSTRTVERSTDWLLQADYESPLGKFGKLELGARGETRIISADYIALRDDDGVLSVLDGLENDFDYFERIGAGYFQYGYKKDKLGIQAGLRTEYTSIGTENSQETDFDLEKDYFNFFPSASLSYQLSEASSTQLSYSRRIRRPWFGGLNPFAGLNDPSEIYRGNPDLDPTYTGRLELNFVHRAEKFTFNPAIYGSRSLDYIEFYRTRLADIIFGLEGGTVLERPINVDREYQYGIELNTEYRPTKGITISHEINYFGYSQRGQFEAQNFDFDFATWSTSLRTNITLPAKLKFQGNLVYGARREEAQNIDLPSYNFRGGLSRKWDNGLTVTANVMSPRFWRTEVNTETFRQEFYGEWTDWRTSLTVSYRFERGASAGERRQRGSIR